MSRHLSSNESPSAIDDADVITARKDALIQTKPRAVTPLKYHIGKDTLCMGAAKINDAGDRVESFDGIITWKYVAKKTQERIACILSFLETAKFHILSLKKKCCSKPGPHEVLTRYSEDYGDYLRNNLVYFIQKYKSFTNKLPDLRDFICSCRAVQDASKTKK